MSAEGSAYSGLDFSELLQVEGELCTPLKRAQWVRDGAEPHKVRAALLSDVFDRCKSRGLKMNDLAPVLAHQTFYARKTDRERQTRIYELFSPTRSRSEDDIAPWQCSQELLAAMLRGLTSSTPAQNERNEVTERIVRFFFPTDLMSPNAVQKAELPPPFFQKERLRSPFAACPHDESESNFYSASLGRLHYESTARVRWFMASGGDLLRSLTGSTFGLWAERMTAALCFGVELTFIIPQADEGETPIQGFLGRFNNYWKSEFNVTTLRHRYPELAKTFTNNIQVAEQAHKHMKVVPVQMSGEAKSVDSEILKRMFPFTPSFRASSEMKGTSQVYGAVFLNPWLRFHWVDVLDTSQSHCEPQYAAIAFNDRYQKTTICIVPPESMLEYLKWLSVFT
jgi:hypothetical protein